MLKIMKKTLLLLFLTACSLSILGQIPRLILPTDKDPLYDLKKQQMLPKEQQLINTQSSRPDVIPNYPSCFEPFTNPAANGWIELPRNDDSSFGPVSLGWNFSLFGTVYNNVYINTNGNITFESSLSQYTPDGFPIGTPMIAAF